MKIVTNIASIVMGFFLAIPICSLFSFFLSEFKNDRSIAIISLLLVVILWFLCSFLLIEKASTVYRVFKLGFLFWASEWFVVAMLSIFFLIAIGLVTGITNEPVEPEMKNLKEATDVMAHSLDIVGQGISAVLRIGMCFLMSIFGLVGYSISVFLPRELQSEA